MDWLLPISWHAVKGWQGSLCFACPGTQVCHMPCLRASTQDTRCMLSDSMPHAPRHTSTHDTRCMLSDSMQHAPLTHKHARHSLHAIRQHRTCPPHTQVRKTLAACYQTACHMLPLHTSMQDTRCMLSDSMPHAPPLHTSMQGTRCMLSDSMRHAPPHTQACKTLAACYQTACLMPPPTHKHARHSLHAIRQHATCPPLHTSMQDTHCMLSDSIGHAPPYTQVRKTLAACYQTA